jgi:uncharacterized protein YciW
VRRRGASASLLRVAAVTGGTTERAELERWYSLHLRPKVARAAEERVIDPAQAAAFEARMAELIRPPRRPVRCRETPVQAEVRGGPGR